MKQEVRKKIQEIMGEMVCPANFKCAEPGFEELCKAKDVGVDDFLECLEPDTEHCTFVLPFAHGYLCQCPLRLYIKKNLKK